MPDQMPEGQSPTGLSRLLRARREAVRPEDAGLSPGTGARRTPGLRREEIAALAGVSIEYYTRLERGWGTRLSPVVIDALARALRLDDEEHECLKTLAATAALRAPVPPKPPSRTVRPAIGMLLESMRPCPGYVVSRTYDVLAANPGGAQLHYGLFEWPPRQRNTIRYTFLHPAARDLFPNWEYKARGCVALLRAIAGKDPDAPGLAALVGELLVKSSDFGRLWDRYEVRPAVAGEQSFRHPLAGTVTLAHETLDVNCADGQRLIAYMASPGTPGHDAMILLDRAGTVNPSGTSP
jgi:transcriptional regulator with XRE-family HTH domain